MYSEMLSMGTLFCKTEPGFEQISENIIIALTVHLQVILQTN